MASTPLLRLSLLRPLPPRHKSPINKTPLLLTSPISLTKSIGSSSGSKFSKRKRTAISMSYQPVPATERLISAMAYCLPFFNGLQYGRYLFVKYPYLGFAFEPIFPLLNAYRSIPYASFVAFFALYLGVVRNPSFSRYVRFNSMQAVVLDVLLALPLLFQRVFNPSKGLGFRALVLGYNSIFVFIVACFVYSVFYSIIGGTPYLPFVADAADRQL